VPVNERLEGTARREPSRRTSNRPTRNQARTINVSTPTRKRDGAAGRLKNSERPEHVEAQPWLPRSSSGLRRTASMTTLIAGLLVLGASGAQGLAYTLAGPVAITGSESGNPGVVGTLLPVGVPSSLAGTIALSSGDTSFVTNDVIVFAIALSAGSATVDEIGVGANSSPVLPNPVGGGAFAEGGSEEPDSVAIGSFTTLKATFEFVLNSLTAGETTRNLFVTYSPAGSALVSGSTVNFSISSGLNFTVQTTLVPEPGTFVLVAGGLALLGLRRRT